MGFYDSRLNFMLQFNTQNEVSLKTGIPQSTISYVSRGIRDLPVEYQTTLRNAYQREAYAQLKNIVPNTTNANRFKWYAPERVNEVMIGMKNMIEQYSYGAVAAVFKSLGRDPTKEEIETALPAAQESVVKGLAKSPNSYEEWEDYPNKRNI